ncbi:MAG: methylmalonyl-CoA carboxyltransferase [Deltaproteobacteria bacterium]|nr:methylmalonyl-CoA carboxyltransferase [Deltaproteobacteria bacterium]
MSLKEAQLERLESMNRAAELSGGEARIAKQHEAGKMTARERMLYFFDEGTFEEIDKFVTHRCTDFGMEKNKIVGDGVVSGYGRVNGRLTYACAQDFTAIGGTLSETNAQKMCKILDMAAKNGAPFIALNDSGGARIHEGVSSLGGYAELFYRNTIYSGVIPQLATILGPCAGGAVYSPAIMDFIIMTKKSSYMFITGPNVIKTVTNEDVTQEKLGGSNTHMKTSGVCHLAGESDQDSIDKVKRLLSFLPQSNREKAPMVNFDGEVEAVIPEFNDIVPADSRRPYDIKKIIKLAADYGDFLEIQPDYAKNLVIGFARFNGESVGIIANQPNFMAGCLDINASDKCARFIRFCDCFNIPLLTFVDVPGFLPGSGQEFGGIIRHGAKIIFAYAEATVPKITITTRKSFGGAYCAMSSRQLGADIHYAYPTAEFSVMGPDGAVNIVFNKELKAAEDPVAKRQELVDNYKENFANPYRAAAYGFVDEVIKPEMTRIKIIRALEMLQDKEEQLPYRKHGNIPL